MIDRMAFAVGAMLVLVVFLTAALWVSSVLYAAYRTFWR